MEEELPVAIADSCAEQSLNRSAAFAILAYSVYHSPFPRFTLSNSDCSKYQPPQRPSGSSNDGPDGGIRTILPFSWRSEGCFWKLLLLRFRTAAWREQLWCWPACWCRVDMQTCCLSSHAHALGTDTEIHRSLSSIWRR